MLLQLLDHQERHLILGVDFRWPGDLFGHFAWLWSLGFEAVFALLFPAPKNRVFQTRNGLPKGFTACRRRLRRNAVRFDFQLRPTEHATG